MRLHDLMLDELAEVRADADRLVERAATSRRHRRLAWTAACAAAALLIGGAGWALAGHGTGTRAVDPAGQGTVPASTRAVAGALATIVRANTALGAPDSWVGLDATPAGLSATATWSQSGTAAPLVQVTLGLFHEDSAGLLAGAGPTQKLSAQQLFDSACSNLTGHCQRTTQPNGDVVLTSRSSGSIDVFLDSPSRDLLVFAMANSPTGPTSLESLGGLDALTALVEDPRLGWQLPVGFERTGDAIAGFTERRMDPNANVPEPSTASGSGSASPAGTVE